MNCHLYATVQAERFVVPKGDTIACIPMSGVKIIGLTRDPVTGNLILTTEQDIREIDPRTGERLRIIIELAGYENPHWLPSGYLAVTGPLGSFGISVIDTTRGEVVDILAPDFPVTAVTIKPTRLAATPPERKAQRNVLLG
jgi:hypothetical protein